MIAYSLSPAHVQKLVGLIVTANTDLIVCDDCFGQISEYAEFTLDGRELPDSMQLIQRHLEQCPCCKGEYEALIEALNEL